MRRAFTLLETVLALALLAMVAVAALGLRTSSLRALERVQRALERQSQSDSLLEMVRSGTLAVKMERVDGRTTVWRGEHLGAAFRVTRTAELVPNPLPAQRDRELPAQMLLYKYVVDYRGQRDELYWHE